MKALSSYAYLAAALTVILYWTQRDDWGTDEAMWIAVVVASVFAALGKAADRWRRRRHQQAQEERARTLFDRLMTIGEDARIAPYVLYLRPFSTTGRLTVSNPKRRWMPLLPSYFARRETLEFETLLADALPDELPLIALGRPGEHVGAARIPVDDADWREAFRRLVEHARWIVMIPSHEGETRWEVQQLIDGKHLDRVVFLMPPAGRSLAIDLPAYWSQMRAGLAPIPLQLPAYNPAGMFFRVGDHGRPTRARYVPRLSGERLRDGFSGIIRPPRRPA